MLRSCLDGLAYCYSRPKEQSLTAKRLCRAHLQPNHVCRSPAISSSSLSAGTCLRALVCGTTMDPRARVGGRRPRGNPQGWQGCALVVCPVLGALLCHTAVVPRTQGTAVARLSYSRGHASQASTTATHWKTAAGYLACVNHAMDATYGWHSLCLSHHIISECNLIVEVYSHSRMQGCGTRCP